ncbi:MAG TPA: response regulator [Lacunisphaera sp.]|nr:response regulator [Lacunisphaera sp.]
MSDSPQHKTDAPRDWVLVVDDDEPIREVLAQFLEGAGVEVLGAGGGLAALDVVASRAAEPVVVFIDVLMPGMDGLTLARKLKSKLKRSTLVIISGHMTDLSWWPVDLREVAFLAKPFRLAEVNEVVAAAQAGFRRGR